MRTFLAFVVCLVIFAAFLLIINNLLNRPTLYTSTATRECAFILNADGTKDSCSMYDHEQKYFHGWSE